MLCTVDIGNTNICVGMMDDDRTLTFTGRMRSNRDKTEEEFLIELKNLLNVYNVSVSTVTGAIISSVVPSLTDVVRSGIHRMMGVQPLVVGHGIRTGIRINAEQPSSVGSDLIVDAVAATEKYDGPLIIFDLGTATTCSVVTEDRTYLGTLIIPGVKISQDALSERCAQLPCIRFENPRHLIGHNTVECMQSGLFYGNAAMIDGLIDRINEEYGWKAAAIITGGIGGLIAPYCKRDLIYDENLLLEGLWYLYHKNVKKIAC